MTMCRVAKKSRSLGWLLLGSVLRGAVFVSCLQFASLVSASCGHYVFTKMEWLAANSVARGHSDGNLGPIEDFCRDLDQTRANPRFSMKHQGPLSPCRGPGCNQGPKGSSIAPVTSEPGRSNGPEVIVSRPVFEFHRSAGFDVVNLPSVVLATFVTDLFRPPRV